MLIVYSHRSATKGSTLVARRAGIKQAASATKSKSDVTPASVIGSLGFTS